LDTRWQRLASKVVLVFVNAMLGKLGFEAYIRTSGAIILRHPNLTL